MTSQQQPTTLLGGILDGSATNQLVTVAAAFITGDGLVVEKNELCVDHEDYRHAASGVSGVGGGGSPQSSMQGSDLGGMERDAAAASRVNDALLTTQQARSAGVMMRTALRMHNPQVFIDHESKRVASEDSCPMDRGVGTQVPFTQMNVVVLPSNENGFCLTGSDDLPYLLSILSDTSDSQPTGSPSSRTPPTSTPGSSSNGCGGAPQITIHTSKRTIKCDALLLDAVSSSSAPSNDDTGSPTQLGLLTSIQHLTAAMSQSSINGANNNGCGGNMDDNEGTVFAGEGGGGGGGGGAAGDGTLSGMDVTSASNTYGEELVRALHRNQKHALAFVVTSAEN